MTVQNLSNTPFDELLECFLLAFDDYYVKMPTDPNYYKQRWKAAKVDFSLSYGMFDNEKLIGFIIHAVDTRNGVLTAYNTGTGVIPEYRGRRVVKSIYEYALKDLKQNGIQKSTLEVITKNERAIKSYESIGFKIGKTFKCYNGTINIGNSDQFTVKEIDLNAIDWSNLPNQESYSWDNQKETILESKYSFFQVVYNNKPESFFIINSQKNYIAQFDVLNTESGNWNRLFTAIKQTSATIKINNVDERLTDKLYNLQAIGLNNIIDQYEMELSIIKQ
ncbi:MAG: GNAT family N-acetyltransferase [Flavobacterium sp. MedPE-SWcel]|uniref:GNAT family N-acetyltransferase n=1 Tax=uncultured Flavobacterium sp. TaxID=165435 RepID=UPI00091EDA63|nr:GNAT family N-acetyltransferase [uncultured Flavobacterium sp.]OIQ16617.1 MAG: GNAT family N-acetyltransferase [Flavobacterium sp. MedPE-SWcel]